MARHDCSRLPSFLTTSAAIVLLSASGSASQRPLPIEQLIDRGTTYVEDFITKFSRVVAEEQYVQDYLELRNEGSRGSFLGTPQRTERRTLKSDLLMVKPPDSRNWYVLRDVFEIDGRAVRDREERLTKLFLESPDTATALRRGEQIAAEGARFHFREAGSYDHPLFAIGFLQRLYRARFRFTIQEQDRSMGPDVWIVTFRETARPTIIRGPGDTNVVAGGRYWIDAPSGRIMQTELVVTALGVQSNITTVFQLDDRLGTSVPVEMRTRFRRGVLGNEIRGAATYGHFRQFDVRTQERIQR